MRLGNLKKCIIVLSALMIVSASATAASDTINRFLFKGKLVINNKLASLNQDIYSIDGSVYVPIRALTESMKGYISYDASDQTIYVEQQQASNKKSVLNDKIEDDSFALHIFSSKAEYEYGEPIEVWARLSNHTEQTHDISHGVSLIEFTITDEEGFASVALTGLAMDSSTFQAGDEFNSNLKQNELLIYNLNKNGLLEKEEDLRAYLNKEVRPSVLPKGNYTITAKTKYWFDSEAVDQAKTLEVSIPVSVK